MWNNENRESHQRYSRSLGPSDNMVRAAAAILGGLSGAALGALAGIDKKIQIEGKSEAEIDIILEKLRKKARMPNYN